MSLQHFFSYTMAASEPIQAFLECFLPVLCMVFIANHWLLSNITVVETMDNIARDINTVAMTPQSSILRKNIGRAWDQISDLLFSSPVSYPLIHTGSAKGKRNKEFTKKQRIHREVFLTAVSSA